MSEILLGIVGILVLIAAMVVLVFFMRKQITQEMRLAQEQILQTARQQMELSQGRRPHSWRCANRRLNILSRDLKKS